MKAIFILLILISGCSHEDDFICDQNQAEKVAEFVLDCINAPHQSGGGPNATMRNCEQLARSIYCKRTQ